MFFILSQAVLDDRIGIGYDNKQFHEEVNYFLVPVLVEKLCFCFFVFLNVGGCGGGGVCVASMPYATRKPVLKALNMEAKSMCRYILYE